MVQQLADLLLLFNGKEVMQICRRETLKSNKDIFSGAQGFPYTEKIISGNGEQPDSWKVHLLTEMPIQTKKNLQ